MEKRFEKNGIWYRVDYFTLAMRKVYRFRMIGKLLYCQPIKN